MTKHEQSDTHWQNPLQLLTHPFDCSKEQCIAQKDMTAIRTETNRMQKLAAICFPEAIEETLDAEVILYFDTKCGLYSNE